MASTSNSNSNLNSSRRLQHNQDAEFVGTRSNGHHEYMLRSAGCAALYFTIEWRVGALRTALDDLAADTILLRDHLLSLSELLHEQVELAEERIKSSVTDRIANHLWLNDNDKTGIADFALESAGAEVVSTNGTEPWPTMPNFLEAALRPSYKANGPRRMLQPGMSPGECWAFRGSHGEAIIRLVSPTQITAVSLEHITKSLSPTGAVHSAPREFEILGLEDADGPATLLARSVYQTNGTPLQTFPLPLPSALFSHVALRVLSNYGHPDYTCVYRLRVHGIPLAELRHLTKNDKPH